MQPSQIHCIKHFIAIILPPLPFAFSKRLEGTYKLLKELKFFSYLYSVSLQAYLLHREQRKTAKYFKRIEKFLLQNIQGLYCRLTGLHYTFLIANNKSEKIKGINALVMGWQWADMWYLISGWHGMASALGPY